LVSTCLRNASESVDVYEQNGQSVNRAAVVTAGGVSRGSIFSLLAVRSNDDGDDRTGDSPENKQLKLISMSIIDFYQSTSVVTDVHQLNVF
jgi:hypothetical protein